MTYLNLVCMFNLFYINTYYYLFIHTLYIVHVDNILNFYATFCFQEICFKIA